MTFCAGPWKKWLLLQAQWFAVLLALISHPEEYLYLLEINTTGVFWGQELWDMHLWQIKIDFSVVHVNYCISDLSMWFDNSSVHPESHCCDGEFCIGVSINLCDLSTSTSSSPYVSTLAGVIDCVLCVSTCTKESEHVNEWMCVLWKDRKGCLIVQEMGVSLLYNFSCKSLVYVMELYVCLCVSVRVCECVVCVK